MPIPERIWMAFVNESKEMRGPYPYDERKNEYVNPWDTNRHRHIRCMMAVAGAWANYHAFDSERDMMAKVTRYCEAEYTETNGKKHKLGMQWDKRQLMAAYNEIRDRWPDEYIGGFEPYAAVTWRGSGATG